MKKLLETFLKRKDEDMPGVAIGETRETWFCGMSGDEGNVVLRNEWRRGKRGSAE